MDYDKVRKLLKKYWEGETDLAEERQLKDFFSQDRELPNDLKHEKSLFVYLKQGENASVPHYDPTEKLRKHWIESKEAPIKKMPWWKQSLKYAAVLVPLLLLGYYLINVNQNKQVITVQTDTFRDPKKAIAETEKALLLLSQNMNDGMSKMESFKLFDEVRNSKKFKAEQNPPKK